MAQEKRPPAEADGLYEITRRSVLGFRKKRRHTTTEVTGRDGNGLPRPPRVSECLYCLQGECHACEGLAFMAVKSLFKTIYVDRGGQFGVASMCRADVTPVVRMMSEAIL